MAPRVDTSLADPALTKFLSRTAALPPDPAVLLKAKLATTSCIAGAPLNLAATDFVANGGSLPASCKQAKPQACVVTVPSPGIRKVDPKIDAAVARIRELLGDTSLLSHTHDKLAEITTIFQSLTAEQASVVFGKLSMAHLARWGHDIQRSPSTPFGYGGLTDADKQTLMGALATKLKGPQLLDVSTMFGSYEDTVKLGSIVAQKSSPETKIEFIKTMASKTTTGVAFRLETHFGSSEDFRGDPEAKAIAAVLGSLQGPAFAVGLNSLLPEQAAKVWVAAVGESIATTGGSPSCTVRYDPQLLLGMIKAAETATPDTRARVFAAAAEQLGTIMESTKAFGVISVGNKEQADHIAMAMAGLLNADQRPKGAVAPQDSGLEQMTSWLSKQIDPEGKAMSTFAYVMLSQKHSAELGSILRTLQSGADGNGVPVTRFERREAGTTGELYWASAERLGWATGSLIVGARMCSDDIKERAKLVGDVFEFTFGLIPMPGPAVVGKIAGKVATESGKALIAEYYRSLGTNPKNFEFAVRELAFPRDSKGNRYEGPASTFFLATEDHVIVANRDL